MALFKIADRRSGAVLFELECGSLKSCVEAAAASDANLSGAYLRNANLSGANLRDANLGDANLGDANLRDAYLGDANLGDANLRDANLSGAYLGGANLRDANLGDARVDEFVVDGVVGAIGAGNPNGWTTWAYVDRDGRQLRVRVGCRHFEIGEGRAYWSSAAHPERVNRREVLAALDYVEAVARLRGWEPPR